MLVALLHTKPTLRAEYLLECMSKGIRSCGDKVLWVKDLKQCQTELAKVDCAVQVCYPNQHKKNEPKKNSPANLRVTANTILTKQKKPVLTIDTGFINNQSDYELEVARGSTTPNVLFDIDNKDTYQNVLLKIYYEVGWQGLKNYAQYLNDNSPGDRWQELGSELKPWRQSGEHILLVGQTFKGLSSQHVNIGDWYRDVIREIRQHTARKILFRHHPRIVKRRPNEPEGRVTEDRELILKAIGKVKNFTWSSGWTMKEDLENAWAAVVFSSNAGVQSVVAGIPTFALDAGCMAWPVADHDLRRIETPSKPSREQWAKNIAYAQWNASELISGASWRHLRPFVESYDPAKQKERPY
jgi:hypothetical protein